MIGQENSTESPEKDEVYTRSVRAGKRTYFFDVKATKGNDFYLTLTESKKVTDHDGRLFYEKHKLFLYREDFAKFIDGLNDVLDYIDIRTQDIPVKKNSYADIEFEDLGNKF